VIYRLSDSSAVTIVTGEGDPVKTEGCKLGGYWSRSLFQRDQLVRKILVDIPEAIVRHEAGCQEPSVDKGKGKCPEPAR
jgi:hypothetical protein